MMSIENDLTEREYMAVILGSCAGSDLLTQQEKTIFMRIESAKLYFNNNEVSRFLTEIGKVLSYNSRYERCMHIAENGISAREIMCFLSTHYMMSKPVMEAESLTKSDAILLNINNSDLKTLLSTISKVVIERIWG